MFRVVPILSIWLITFQLLRFPIITSDKWAHVCLPPDGSWLHEHGAIHTPLRGAGPDLVHDYTGLLLRRGQLFPSVWVFVLLWFAEESLLQAAISNATGSLCDVAEICLFPLHETDSP